MRWNPMGSRTPIGVDIGGRHIKAAQLRRSGNLWRIAALCRIPRIKPGKEIDQEEVRYLHSVLRRQGFAGKSVVLAVPTDKLLTGIFEVPPRNSAAPIDQIVQTELSRLHKVPAAALELSYWDLPESAKSSAPAQVMAAGCAHGEANKLLDTFEQAGLHVAALDAHPCALPRACSTMLAPEPDITAVLDIGWAASGLSIICNGVVMYERMLSIAGVESLTEAVASRFGLDAEAINRVLTEVGFNSASQPNEADQQLFDHVTKVLKRHFSVMADGLKAPFAYASQQCAHGEVKRLLLVGGGAGIPGLDRFLDQTLETEVLTVRPADLVECPSSLLTESCDPALTLVVGLAKFDEG